MPLHCISGIKLCHFNIHFKVKTITQTITIYLSVNAMKMGHTHTMLYNNKADPNSLFQVCFTTKDTDIGIRQSSCDCPIGLSGKCGHVAGLMYQIANYKTLGLKALPEDIAKTSQPQTWHIPRGTKITGKAVQDLEVSGYSKEGPCEAMPRNIKSTLYNPVRGQPIDWCVHARKLSAVTPDLLVLPALCETACSVPCSFGPVPKGCILSYQQKPSEDCILNISDGIGFPELPASNVMRNTYSTVLSSEQSVKLEGLKLTLHEVNKKCYSM